MRIVQIARKIDGQIGKRTDKRFDKHTNGQINVKWLNGKIDKGQTDRRTNVNVKCMNGQTDKWTNR